MTHEVQIAPTARKQFRKLPTQIRSRIQPVLLGLANNPRPNGAIKLKGSEARWRIRVGNYRVIYRINEQGKIVIILVIAHRREAYR